MSLDDHKLCSPITNRKIKLETESSSGLIVSLGRLKDHSWAWEKNFICSFKVQTRSHLGLFIVIQNIVFRKNLSTDECIDYVQYKRSDGSTSKKYCGRLNAALGMDRIFAPDVYATELAPTVNSFIDPTGIVDVNIYISREALKAYEEMELEIAFTTFSYCYISSKDQNQQCNSKFKEHCIYKGFFNDGYVNCPYPDCVDEGGCSDNNKVQESHTSVGNKVVIGSVTTLFIVFVCFICCLWLCRKYKKLCWSNTFAGPTTTNENTQSVDANESNMHPIPMPSTTRVVASTAVTSVNLEEDKDLPPSYDSLFPNR